MTKHIGRGTLSDEEEKAGKICIAKKAKKYRLFAGWEVRIVKNCDQGLEIVFKPKFTVFHYTD